MSLKNKFASGLGSVLEWYDFSLYGFFAPLLAQVYFPSESSAIALLKTFSVFTIGFIARPLGALVFGYISDKYGRTVSLKLTPLLITCPTLLFCFLPSYQQIGLSAPILLVILRIWQGICIGGEYSNNIVYLCESTNKKNLYLMGSIGSCTGSCGILLASAVAAICYALFSHENLILYGWRVAFSISLIIGLVAFFLRRKMEETIVFQNLEENNAIINNPIFDSYKHQWKDYFLSFGLTFLPATAFYYIFIFLPNFLSQVLNYDSSKILGDNAQTLLMRLFIIPILGIIADKIGGIKIARLSCVLFLLLGVPLFYNILYYPTFATVSLYIFALLTTLNAATTPGLLVQILKPATRCTILSFTFNICFGFFGGITAFICFLLIETFGSNMLPIFYLLFAAAITLIATFFFDKKVILENEK